MDDVAKIINLNYRPGSEHTVEFEDKGGTIVLFVFQLALCILDMLNKPLLSVYSTKGSII